MWAMNDINKKYFSVDGGNTRIRHVYLHTTLQPIHAHFALGCNIFNICYGTEIAIRAFT
jgi:hypothetical protein